IPNTVVSDLGDVIFTNSNQSKPRKRKAPVFQTEIALYEKVEGREYDNELGELKSVEHNELLLSGAIFLAEKLTNVDAPISPKTINTELGIAVNENPAGFTGKRRESAICLYGVGTGGSGNNFNSIVPVEFNERIIKNFIPIRRVATEKDLSEVERQKYFMKKVDNGYYEYYLKKFEIEPAIKVEYDEPGSPSVPPNYDEAPADKVINTYMQFNIKISKYDVREFFKTKGGGIENARINTLGLFFGYPESSGGSTEYKGVQLFSKLNFNNEPLDNETKELNIIYKIYIG
ncbi:hypothetical protein V6O07_23720, partial [Arthrospira platensis SPKY2]